MTLGEGKTPTLSKIFEPTTHSRMEMGGDIIGFYYRISKSKMTRLCHHGASGHTKKINKLYTCVVYQWNKSDFEHFY